MERVGGLASNCPTTRGDCRRCENRPKVRERDTPGRVVKLTLVSKRLLDDTKRTDSVMRSLQ
jgi:hypothetical protein